MTSIDHRSHLHGFQIQPRIGHFLNVPLGREEILVFQLSSKLTNFPHFRSNYQTEIILTELIHVTTCPDFKFLYQYVFYSLFIVDSLIGTILKPKLNQFYRKLTNFGTSSDSKIAKSPKCLIRYLTEFFTSQMSPNFNFILFFKSYVY